MYINSLFLKDQILQVDDIFSLELGKFVYKFNNNQLPPVFDNYFKDLTEIHDHNTRGKEDNYFVERINSKMGSNTLKSRTTIDRTLNLAFLDFLLEADFFITFL